jgi:hypothetical protein
MMYVQDSIHVASALYHEQLGTDLQPTPHTHTHYHASWCLFSLLLSNTRTPPSPTCLRNTRTTLPRPGGAPTRV